MKVVLHDDFGGEHDITEVVKEMYKNTEILLDSGSGFMEAAEELQMLEVGYILGIDGLDERVENTKKYIENLHKRLNDPNKNWIEPDKVFKSLTEAVARETSFLEGLNAIKERRANLFKMTDDVTDFDDEGV